MRYSYEVLKNVIGRTGVKTVAAELNISKALVYKWCHEIKKNSSSTQSGAVNPLDRIQKIYDLTQDLDLIYWICEMANGYFVANTENKNANFNVKMLENIQRFIKEFSETLETISTCYYKDNRINSQEAKLIRKEWEDLKRIGEGFVKACEMGNFDKTGGWS